MSTGVILALAAGAAVGWGASDFFGGDSTGRGVSVFTVVCVSEVIGAVAVIPALVARGRGLPSAGATIDGLIAGASVACELSLIYTMLSRGLAFVTAPVGAVGAALAAAVGLLSGDPFGALIGVGLLCAVGGSALSSWSSPTDGSAPRAGRADVCMALGAAVSVCVTLSTLHGAGEGDPYWATELEHASTALASGGAAAIVALRRRRAAATSAGAATTANTVTTVGTATTAGTATGNRDGTGPGHGRLNPRWLAVLGLIAICGTAADLSYAAASHRGALTIVAAVSSLYPVMTILLGRVLRQQRASPVQLLGVGLALAGTVLLGIGTS